MARGGSPVPDRGLRFLCPNGHLGFAPLHTDSFRRGLASGVDFIVADSGSDDIGPGPLGSDTSVSPLTWQTHDLEQMLLASRRLGIPMIVGSAGDTGTNSRVDLYVQIIRELAAKHSLPPFRLGYFYSEVTHGRLFEELAAGRRIEGLDGRPHLDADTIRRTDRIVAMAGVHPYIRLLDAGADVIIGGRSSDSVLFAAPAIRSGYPEGLAYYLGKVLECASFNAEPYGGKESVVGEITGDSVYVTAMHPDQRCTVASVSAHAMYERANPFYEYVAGGLLDMTKCRYEQVDERTTRVTGPTFHPASPVRVKLEGAGKVGERFIGMAAIRDPYVISRLDDVIGWAQERVRSAVSAKDYQLYYHVYGRNGVMSDMEPVRNPKPHEVLIVVEAVAGDPNVAHEVCLMGTRQLFYARLGQSTGTAGGVAFLLDEVLRASPAYEWTMNHTMAVDDPLELFPTQVITVAS
ncbi:MAG: DUF1446 domain-containing protein [Firmicutes bacterium]|nr:DUF1446 domain-containing protein [Bacillota bacterium]